MIFEEERTKLSVIKLAGDSLANWQRHAVQCCVT